MYRPQLNPGEEIVITSPDVTVKNASFDAVLTNKRIIFAKKTDDLYEKKELVFPLNLVRGFEPRADQAGTPTIEFSIQKPAGDLGDLILKFSQTGDYRYSERDEWIDKLKRVVPRTPDMRRDEPVFKPQQMPPQTPPNAQSGMIPGINQGYPKAQYNNIPPVQDTFAPAPPPGMPPAGQARYPPQGMPPAMPPREENRPPLIPDRRPAPPAANQGNYEKPSFCRFCGANMPAGSVFCPSCGRRTEEAPAQEHFARPPAPPMNQRPPAPPVPPAGRFSPADEHGFVKQRGRERPPKQSRPPSPGKDQKNQQKAYRLAEKQRLKDAKLAEKAQKKAMRRTGRDDYDPYGYKESRIPQGLPKILGIVVAVVIVLAVAAYVVNSGMLSGSETPAASSGNTGSSTTTTEYTPGSTTVSDSFGTWNIQVIYSGEWSGSYTVNGVKTTITDSDGETAMYGYKQITLDNPSGTIEVTVTKEDSGTGVLMLDILNQKGQYASSESTSAEYGTVTASAVVS